VPNKASFASLDFSMQGYRTEYMWTLSATAALVWRL
jgi:hypothetical protein